MGTVLTLALHMPQQGVQREVVVLPLVAGGASPMWSSRPHASVYRAKDSLKTAHIVQEQEASSYRILAWVLPFSEKVWSLGE